MEKETHFFIEKLDQGFILNQGSKRRAIANKQELVRLIECALADHLTILDRVDCHDLSLNIKSDFNLPKAAQDA